MWVRITHKKGTDVIEFDDDLQQYVVKHKGILFAWDEEPEEYEELIDKLAEAYWEKIDSIARYISADLEEMYGAHSIEDIKEKLGMPVIDPDNGEITYSYKAEKHKAITPYLRYGIMIGGRDKYPLPGRLFRHGTNFDFMFSFVGTDPDRKEWKTFTEMLEKEVEYSRLMEEMFRENRSKRRKRYFMLQKQLVLKESGECKEVSP